MIENDKLQEFKDDRYKNWNTGIGKDMMAGKATLDDMASYCLEGNTSPEPVSGRQEYLENVVTYAVK